MSELTLLGIYGGGGFGHEVADVVHRMFADVRHGIKVVFIDDFREPGTYNQYDFYTREGFLAQPHDKFVTIAIGDRWLRHEMATRFGDDDYFSVRDPSAIISPSAEIHPTATLCAHTMVNAGATIARHSHINIYSYVAHDASVGSFVTVCPRVSINGGVRIGDDVFIGTGAVIAPGVLVGHGAAIGAGAVVLSYVPDGATVVGAPARPV